MVSSNSISPQFMLLMQITLHPEEQWFTVNRFRDENVLLSDSRYPVRRYANGGFAEGNAAKASGKKVIC